MNAIVRGNVVKNIQPSTELAPVESRSPIQLKMNFSGENPLADALRAGRFILLLEQNTPSREQPLDAAMVNALAVARRAAGLPEVAGMAVSDRLKSEDSHDPVEVAAQLAAAAGKPSLMTLSGKGSGRERLRDILARAASLGIRNILCVTGDRSDRHELKRDLLGRAAPYAKGYFGSVEAIRLIRSTTAGLYGGAGVNPFKYNAPDQFLQYFKMLRKINSGAQFIVTHAGWDMKKLQELQWFLQMRDLSWPVIARVPLLTTAEVERIHEQWQPGVHASRLFYAMLQRESNLNPAQGMATQLQRVALQVIGCRIMGYSGVQITGVRDVGVLDMVMAKIRESQQRIRNWPDWVQAWNEFHNFIEFAPYSNSFYAFDGLLKADRPHYQAGTGPARHSLPLGLRLRARDRFDAALFRVRRASCTPEWLKNSLKTLAGCRHCAHGDCGAERCEGLCPRFCPKLLSGGACGGSRPDGLCEFDDTPCFHHRVLALAATRGALDSLEEGQEES